jgi:hypothetical protein
MRKPHSVVLLFFGVLSTAVAQPTITGVNAFWWLGSGINSDYDYYAQAAWTANANGASGTPTWHVSTVSGGGSVSLSCTFCTNTTATSTAPSNGCTYDVTVYVTYPDSSQSANFYVAIVRPTTTTLLSGYPTDDPRTAGYLSTTKWNLTDSCGYSDPGLDGNETFGTWTDDYVGNNWGHPTPQQTYIADSTWYDLQGNTGWTDPLCEIPQSPLTTVKVYHSSWTLWVGTQTFGSGVSVRADTSQFYQDHGRHQ